MQQQQQLVQPRLERKRDFHGVLAATVVEIIPGKTMFEEIATDIQIAVCHAVLGPMQVLNVSTSVISMLLHLVSNFRFFFNSR